MDPAWPLIAQDRNNRPWDSAWRPILGMLREQANKKGELAEEMAVSPGCWAEGGHPGTGMGTDRVTSAHPCPRACS